MNYDDKKTVELYVDFLWQQRDYWQTVANANKEDLEYYRGIVDYLIENGRLTLEEAVEIGDKLEGDDD